MCSVGRFVCAIGSLIHMLSMYLSIENGLHQNINVHGHESEYHSQTYGCLWKTNYITYIENSDIGYEIFRQAF